ncbi:MAG: AMP-binding protein, partial [Deltaproteobacteria bacterium]|nr:AMP-binding protein [Deltaproteobacteria bacterium]
MGTIPESYLPPKELWPERPYELPEYRDVPQNFNACEELIDANVKAGRGDKIAIKFMDQEITYSQFLSSICRVANGLKKLGIEENDRVFMRMPNIPPLLYCNFAALRIGAVALPTSILFARSEIAHVANLSESKIII